MVARTAHFEVYSQAGVVSATSTLQKFEQLRSFFGSNLFSLQSDEKSSDAQKPPLRVLVFRTRSQYDAVRLRSTADAYYTGSAERQYIVMPYAGADDVRTAAHEYAHAFLYDAELRLPPWLNEGLAEVFSTASAGTNGFFIGGPIPSRLQTLRLQPWLAVPDLLASASSSSVRGSRTQAAVFYAQSWLAVDMLTGDGALTSRFGEFVRMLNHDGVSSEEALSSVYGLSPQVLQSALRHWADKGGSVARSVSVISGRITTPVVASVPEQQWEAVLGDLFVTDGEYARAEDVYLRLLQQNPKNDLTLAALGTISLRKGDRVAAMKYGREALDAGLHDAAQCYRYAVLAEEMQLPRAEIERALERAIAQDPHFDDARYRLALLLSNAGDFAAAADQLQAMAEPSGARAFGYWAALAYASNECGRRTAAERAAQRASQAARTAEERARAASLAYIAQTDLAVRFARAPDGSSQLVTTRVPHGSSQFNPFIEPDDQIATASGTLREVQCSGGKLVAFVVQTEAGRLELAVPDPQHVLISHGPSEFTCGAQFPARVTAEYATTASPHSPVLRGLSFSGGG